MSRRKTFIFLILIFVLALFAASLSYPQGVKKLGFNLPQSWEAPFKLGLDLQGGTHLVYEADLSVIGDQDISSAMEGLRDIIERRVNLFGVAEPIVQTQESSGHNRLVVELAGIKDPAEAIKMIGQTPFLEFKEQRTEEETRAIVDKQIEIEGMTPEERQEIDNWELAFEDPNFKPTALNGKYLKKAEVGFEQNSQKPMILMQFNDEGSDIFEEITSRSIGKVVAIYIDGILLSAPVVQSAISGGKAQITGEFTVQEAKELARNLNAGALPVPIELISQQSVGPTLGEVSLKRSLNAGLLGFLAIIIFLILFYRLPGILASLSLIIYITLVLALMKLVGVTLTLAGIGGLILSIGMAVDANILIFSRIREELKDGSNFTIALEEGFRRSWPSIRDGNMTTLIVAFILFWFGTSFIKGFAFTLSIGILISMFSAIFITRTFLRAFAGTKLDSIKWLWK